MPSFVLTESPVLSPLNRDLRICGSEGDTEGGREREEKRDNQTLGHNFPPTAVFLQQVGIKT